MIFNKVLIIFLFIISGTNSCIKPAPNLGLSYGAFLRPGGIDFRILAPSSEKIYLVIFSKPDDQSGEEFPMKRLNNGVWSYFLEHAGPGTIYGYRLKGPLNDSSIVISDPYSKAAVTQNTWRHVAKSLVINTDFNWKGDTWINIEPEDLIIYEAHLRDMTAHPSSGAFSSGSYKGFIEQNQYGSINYLKNLGINAIQFLPLWDFANVEIPYRQEVDGMVNTWNPYERNHWGYMPTFFLAPESYYASDGTKVAGEWNGKDGRAIRELKEVIRTLHKNDIAVIMDVVVNHVSNYDWHPLKYIDRELYFKLDKNGNFLSQCCGNLLNTDNEHVINYIIESLIYWMIEYHVDGFRFDQAHLLSNKTAKYIIDKLKSVNPNVIIYGEAWDNRGQEFSALGWGSFNDKFRDVLRGDLYDFSKKGFLFGTYRPNESKDDLKTIITGTLLNNGGIYDTPSKSINFLEVHDNYSFSDFLRISTEKNSTNELIKDKLNHITLTPQIFKINTLAAIILLTSQGIPLIHQGQEWAHSKIIAPTQKPDPDVGKMDPNPYNKDNETNWINWEETNQNQDLINYYIGLISLRNTYPELRRSSTRDIVFLDVENEFGLGYMIRNNITIFLNSNPSDILNVKLPPGKWLQVVNSNAVNLNGLRITEGYVNIQATSGAVFIKK
ncbi:MAG: pullulanase [Candidatus Marinimicrobia bacterium]|nr:pullulanase [Candidatus Neomarinimicrobiota bacterium]